MRITQLIVDFIIIIKEFVINVLYLENLLESCMNGDQSEIEEAIGS